MKKISLILAISTSFVVGTLVAGNLVFAAPADSQNELLSAILQEVQALTGLVGNLNPLSQVELVPVTTPDGRVHPGVGPSLLLYGDTLCGIEAIQERGAVIVFATQTTVQHNRSTCGTGPFQPILLDTATDEVFQVGDVLALSRGSSSTIIEVYREQTP